MILKDKVIFITGASRGIGRALAERCAREGARLFLTARTKKDLEIAKEELSIASDVEIYVSDISDEDSVKGAASICVNKYGRIDVLMNNAGVMGPVGFLETNDSFAWENTVKINLIGTFYTLQAALPVLKRQRSGKIIIMAGGGAVSPKFTAYGSSKAAVIRLTESLAEELKGTGIDVNAVSPGPTKTKIVESLIAQGIFPEDHFKDSYGKIGDLCVFLASSESDDLSGKFFSAQWDTIDALKKYKKEIMESDIFTVRRILPKDKGYDWQ